MEKAQKHDEVPQRSVGAGDARPVVIHLPGTASLSRSGITFPRRLSQRAWEGIGAQLAEVSNSSAWWLADWLIYGETAYSGRYRDAIERTGLDYQTLRNYAWVARRFDQSRRRENLSLAHHAEVARLSPPEQDYWLRKAEQGEWSRNKLRKEVRTSLTQRKDVPAAVPAAGPAATPAPPSQAVPGDGTGRHVGLPAGSPVGDECAPDQVALEVELQPEQLDRCVQAAVSCGMSVTDWAARVLQMASGGRSWRRLRADAAVAEGQFAQEPARSGRAQRDDDVVATEAEGVAECREFAAG